MQSITYSNNNKDNKKNDNGINQNSFLSVNNKYTKFNKDSKIDKTERNN